MFKIHDIYGIIAAMFGLVLIYLVLNNSNAFSQVTTSAGDASNNLLKTLQGR